MLAFVAAGGLAGAAAAPRLRTLVSRRAIVVGYPWIGVAALAALTALPPPLAMGALFGSWVFFGSLWDAIVVGYRLTIVPDELQGRVESVSSLIAFGGAALGPLAAGAAFTGFRRADDDRLDRRMDARGRDRRHPERVTPARVGRHTQAA